MIGKYLTSRMEIWSAEYVNNPKIREAKDKNAKVVQIEPSGTQGFFMVEVIEKEDFFGG